METTVYHKNLSGTDLHSPKAHVSSHETGSDALSLDNIPFSYSSMVATDLQAAVEEAFNNTTPVELDAVTESIIPDTDNAYDIGTSSLRWKDLYLGGDIRVDGGTFTIGNAPTSGGFLDGYCQLILTNNQGNYPTSLIIKGGQTGGNNSVGNITVLDEDEDVNLQMEVWDDLAGLYAYATGGKRPRLVLQVGSNYDGLTGGAGVTIGEEAVEGVVGSLKIHGRATGYSREYGELTLVEVGSDQVFRISSDTGEIDFADENLTGTGTLDIGAITVTGNVLPEADSTRDLGSSSKYWSNIYVDKIFLNSTATLDGTVAGAITATGFVFEGNRELLRYNFLFGGSS